MAPVVRLKRSANGVGDKPIALRLSPEERLLAEQLSKQVGMKKATFARQAFLAGASLVVASHNKASGDHHE